MSLATQRDNLVLHYPLSGAPESNSNIIHPRGLPAAYQEVEWIESDHTGNTYIFLNLTFPSPCTETLVLTSSVLFTNLNSTHRSIICAFGDGSKGHYAELYTSNKFGVFGQYSGNVINIGTRYFIKYKLIPGSSCEFTANGTTNRTTGAQSTTINASSLFTLTGTTEYTCLDMRMYHTKLFLGDNLISDCYPCYRISDKKPGMYDMVRDIFLAGQGTGTFKVGPLIKSIPNTYIPLLAVYSTGTNCKVSLNWTETNNSQIDCKFFTPNTAVNDYLFGQSQQGSMMYNGLYRNNVLEYNFSSIGYTAASTVIMDQHITGTNNIIRINNQSFIRATGTSNGTTMYLFASNNGSRYYNAPLYCYYFRVYDGNNLIRDLRPAKQISNNTIGLYDLVNDIFYTSSGSVPLAIGTLAKIEYNITNQNNNNYQGLSTRDIQELLTYDTPRYNYSYLFTDGKGITSGTFTNNFNNAFSISWWMKTSTASSSMPWGSMNGNRLNFYFSGGKLYHNTSDGAQNPYQNSGTDLTNTITNDGQWHHYVVTGNGTLNNLYKDGELIGKSKTYKGFTATQVHINGWAENAYPFPGSISDFRLYKAVLTEAEIKELYDMGKTS